MLGKLQLSQRFLDTMASFWSPAPLECHKPALMELGALASASKNPQKPGPWLRGSISFDGCWWLSKSQNGGGGPFNPPLAG